MSKKDIEAFAKEIKAFVESSKGKESIERAIKNAIEAKEYFDKATRVNIENLYKPMTI